MTDPNNAQAITIKQAAQRLLDALDINDELSSETVELFYDREPMAALRRIMEEGE